VQNLTHFTVSENLS